MRRQSFVILGAAGILAAGIGCSSHGAFSDVAVTEDPSIVAGCQKLDDVSVEPSKIGSDTPGRDETTQLTEKARVKGANYLLITEHSADKNSARGTAYLCNAAPAGSGAASHGSR